MAEETSNKQSRPGAFSSWMTLILAILTVTTSITLVFLNVVSTARELKNGSPIIIFGIPVSELQQEAILLVIGFLAGRILLERWSLTIQIQSIYEKVKRIWGYLGIPRSIQNVSLFTERTNIGTSHPHQYEDYIKDAKKEIIIIGIDSRTTIDSYIGSLINKLKAEPKCHIYFLLMNPINDTGQTSYLVENIANVIGKDVVVQRINIEERLKRLKEIKEQQLNQGEKKRWHIMVYDFSSTFTFLSVDGDQEYGKILYGIVPFRPEDKNHWPLIEFRRENDDSGMAKTLYDYHKRMITSTKEPDWSKFV